MRADKLQYGQVSSLLPLKFGFFQVRLNFLMLNMSVVDKSGHQQIVFVSLRLAFGLALGSFNEDKVVGGDAVPVLEQSFEKSGSTCFSEPHVTM